MIFLGEPGKVLYDIQSHRSFRFNKDGRLEVRNRSIIKKLKRKFPVLQEEAAIETDKKHICKKCGAEFDNVGNMLAHIRKEHPKGGD